MTYAGTTLRYMLEEDRITIYGVMLRRKDVPQFLVEEHLLLLEAALCNHITIRLFI